MKVDKKDLEKSQIELTVELSYEEFKPYIELGAKKVSAEVKIEGFRPGKVPFDVLKQKIGEMTILEEAARVAINKTIEKVVKENCERDVVGQPKVDITKIAPNNPMEYKITIALLPQITLGEYKNLKIKEGKPEVKDEDVSRMLENLREMRATEAAVNREIKDGDKAVVDIEMFLDKVPLEGGQGKNTNVLVGKDYIVKGFDKKIIGAKKNEVKEFSLPYPRDYHMNNLAGKLVDFKVTIKDIFERTLPELNDEFSKNFGLKNLNGLKENIEKSMISEKEREAKLKAEQEMLEKIVSKSKFGDIAQILIEHETGAMLRELEQGIAQQGGKFEDYLKSLNKTRDQLTLDLLPEALKRVKVSLVIREVGDKEKIKVENKEIDDYISEIKKQYKDNNDLMREVETPAYKNYVANVLTSKKIIDKLREWNVV